LESRKTDDQSTINLRVHEAKEDMTHWSEFDYCVINDDLSKAKEELESIFFEKNNLNSTKNSKLIKKIHKILYR
jgi:guanylate kinase